jgi:hypothetical protein
MSSWCWVLTATSCRQPSTRPVLASSSTPIPIAGWRRPWPLAFVPQDRTSSGWRCSWATGEAPTDLETRNRHNVGGSCHGGEFVTAQGDVLVGWPTYRLPVDGLYQTGATAHPGGSVSGRAGRNAARVLLTDLGIDPATVMGPGA